MLFFWVKLRIFINDPIFIHLIQNRNRTHKEKLFHLFFFGYIEHVFSAFHIGSEHFLSIFWMKTHFCRGVIDLLHTIQNHSERIQIPQIYIHPLYLLKQPLSIYRIKEPRFFDFFYITAFSLGSSHFFAFFKEF